MQGRLAAFVLLACAPAPAVAHAAPVRIFAVGHQQQLDDAVTYASFRYKMAAIMCATHPGRATLVQVGVDDVASHLAPVDPAAPDNALVVFPEDTGLLPAFIGTRGAAGRATNN